MAEKTGSQKIADASQSVSKGKQVGCSQFHHNFTTDTVGEPQGNTVCDCKQKRYGEMKGK